MNRYLRFACLTGTLALLLLGCTLLPDIQNLLQEAEELLPLAPIGGIPIQVVAEVDFDYRETIEGSELVSSAGAWTHTVEGRLLNTIGWLPHLDRIDGAHGSGRIHCHHPAGPEYDWTVQWSSELSFDDREREVAPPLIHVAIYGSDVLVLYAPPIGFYHWHPGSRDDCQNPEPVAAYQAIGNLWFPLDDVDVERAPDADVSTETAIQDGLVVLRIPLDRLSSGVLETNTVNLGSTHQATYGTYEWGLRVTLTLTSSPGES